MDNLPLLKYELMVAWYELVINREKLYVHLKKLSDNANGKMHMLVSIHRLFVIRMYVRFYNPRSTTTELYFMSLIIIVQTSVCSVSL